MWNHRNGDVNDRLCWGNKILKQPRVGKHRQVELYRARRVWIGEGMDYCLRIPYCIGRQYVVSHGRDMYITFPYARDEGVVRREVVDASTD